MLRIREAVGSVTELRVDANRGWTLGEALRFGAAVRGAGLDFVEEPTQDTEDWEAFYLETGEPGVMVCVIPFFSVHVHP